MSGLRLLVSTTTIFVLAFGLVACQEIESEPPDNTTRAQSLTHAPDAGVVPSYPVENTGADCVISPKLAYADLPVIEALPDPFRWMNGEQVTTVSEWRCRRAEISAQLQRWVYGHKPDPAGKVSAETGPNSLTVTVSDQGNTIEFTADIQWPTSGTPPYPAMIGIGPPRLDTDQLLDMGVAIINFPNNELGAHAGLESRGKGLFFELYGEDQGAASTIAWAWGISRLIDALEQLDNLAIDPARLGVTGCSRNGKGAIVSGALDERLVLTIVQESGSGGSAAWRVADAQLDRGQNVQTARQIVTENTWLGTDFEQFGESVPKLPVDNHELLGLVAPRGLLLLENTGIEWLGSESAWTSALAAREIYNALGVPNNMGVTQVGGHRHCVLPESQQPAVDAFVKRFLLGESVDTAIVETDAGYTADYQRWIPWTTPDLTPK